MPEETTPYCPEYFGDNCPLKDIVADNERLRKKVDEQSQTIAQLEATILEITGSESPPSKDKKPKFKPSRRTRKR